MGTAWFWGTSSYVSGTRQEESGKWEHEIHPPHLIWSAHSSTGLVSKEVRAAAEGYGCTATTTPSGWTTSEAFSAWAKHEF